MQHSCDKCGTPVEDGVSFCPACAAPQIRVSVAPSEALPAGAPLSLRAPGALDWPQALPLAVVVGVAAAMLALFTAPLLRGAMLIWVLVGGAACVALYRRRRPQALITGGAGARLGALCGLFSFGSFSLVLALLLLAARGPELRQALREQVEQAARRNPDPQAQEILQRFTTPEGLALFLALGMAFLLVAFVVLGAIGGALSASLGRQKN